MKTDNQSWNTNLYNEKHAFVYQYGQQIVGLLAPKHGERILDLGCGSGQLTNEIAGYGAKVMGIDYAKEMIEDAKGRYPELEFKVMDATNFSLDRPVDAIFSNAVLHWIKDKEAVVRSVYSNLEKGGRFVAEFGGLKCVENIKQAIKRQLKNHGYKGQSENDIWFFQSTAGFATTLEKAGFLVKTIWHIDRPTELDDPETGMKDWINMFANNFFKGIEPEEKEFIIDKAVEDLRPTNFKNGKWFADYTRLRTVAIK